MRGYWLDALAYAVAAGVAAVFATESRTPSHRAACWVLAVACAGFFFAELIAMARRREGR